jgi:hypothetical protein
MSALCQKRTLDQLHSITLLVRADTVGGMSKPKGFGGFSGLRLCHWLPSRRDMIAKLRAPRRTGDRWQPIV